jgi:hypothetical protein
MIRAAAEAGCDAVKIQHYGRVNPKDPQAAWLEGARLNAFAIGQLRQYAERCEVLFIATPFDAQSLIDLRGAGVKPSRLPAARVTRDWWQAGLMSSGSCRCRGAWGVPIGAVNLTAVPLYPTPLECVSRAPLLDGWRITRWASVPAST